MKYQPKRLTKRLFTLLILSFSLPFATQFQMAAQAQTAAENPEGALAFVDKLANDALAVLNDVTITQEERDQAFRDLLADGFDLGYIGKLVLGSHRRRATPEQLAEYNRIFPEYVLRIYASRLTEFGDERFVVGTTQKAGKRDIYVRSQVVRPDGPPISADWRVRLVNGEFKVVDLRIEGISMVITQRDEFAAKISKDGLDSLIEGLRRRAGLSRDDGDSSANNAAL